MARAALGAVAVPAAVGVRRSSPTRAGRVRARRLSACAVVGRVALAPERPVPDVPVSTAVAEAAAGRVERFAVRGAPPRCSVVPVGELLPRP
jgi:hypothetical protein